MSKLIAVATADWHATFRNTPCRSDNLRETLLTKLRIIYGRSVPVIAAGDLLDSHDESYEVASMLHEVVRTGTTLFVYGQHDLPQHNLKEAKRGGTHFLSKTLSSFARLQLDLYYELDTCSNLHPVQVYGCSWGEKFDPAVLKKSDYRILVVHRSVWSQKNTNSYYYGVLDKNSVDVLHSKPEFSSFDLVISGDNHGAFIRQFTNDTTCSGKTIWLNCGPILRLKANESAPPLYYEIWQKDTGAFKVVPVVLPYTELTREHIDAPKEEEKLISQFTKGMKQGTTKVEFKDILTSLAESDSVTERTRRMIWAAYERARSQKR